MISISTPRRRGRGVLLLSALLCGFLAPALHPALAQDETAGFSGIVAAFNRQGDQWGVADQMRVRSLIVTSLTAMFFALLPSGLDVPQLAERSIWRTSRA